MYKLLSNVSNCNFQFFHEKRIKTNKNYDGSELNLPNHYIIEMLCNNNLIGNETLQVSSISNHLISKIPILDLCFFLTNYSNYNNGISLDNADLYFQLEKLAFLSKIKCIDFDEGNLNQLIIAILKCEKLFTKFNNKYITSLETNKMIYQGEINKIFEQAAQAYNQALIKASNELFLESIIVFFINFLVYRVTIYNKPFSLIEQVSDLLYAFPLNKIFDQDKEFYETFIEEFIEIYNNYILKFTNIIGLTSRPCIKDINEEIIINPSIKNLLNWNENLIFSTSA